MSSCFKKLFQVVFLGSTLIIFLTPSIGLAVITEYQTLAPIQPFIGTTVPLNGLSTYLKTLHRLGIALCTGLAVIMIVKGGLQYVSTEAVGGKGDGKQAIQDALLGLLLALTSVLLLQTLNPALLRSDLNIQATAPVPTVTTTAGGLPSDVGPGLGTPPRTVSPNDTDPNFAGPLPDSNDPSRPGNIPTGKNVSHFGTTKDVRTIRGTDAAGNPVYYALVRTSEGQPPEGNYDPNKVDVKFGSTWYYALDANGQRINYPQGSVNAAGGYSEKTAISGQYFRDMGASTIGFAAPVNQTQANALGLPFINSNSTLRNKTLVVTTSDGRTLRYPVVERSGAPVGTWEFTYGGAVQLNGASIVSGRYE